MKNKQILYYSILIFVLLLAPLFIRQQYIIHIMIMSIIVGVLSVSWNIVSGYLGVFTFGHPAFYGLGAYSSALLALHTGMSPWLTMLLAGLIAAVFSLLVALPTLRLRGPYVAVVSLSFMLILEQVCYNWTSLTKGPMGLAGIPELTNIRLPGFEIAFDGISRVPNYYVAVLILIVTMICMYAIVESRIGLQLEAIRDAEEAAAATGVKVTQTKIIIFFITSFFAGWIGGFYAHYIMLLTPGVFAFIIMASILTSTLIGGWGTLFGPLIGAFVLTILIDNLKNIGDIYHFFHGAFLIAMIFFMPKGIVISLRKALKLLSKVNQSH